METVTNRVRGVSKTYIAGEANELSSSHTIESVSHSVSQFSTITGSLYSLMLMPCRARRNLKCLCGRPARLWRRHVNGGAGKNSDKRTVVVIRFCFTCSVASDIPVEIQHYALNADDGSDFFGVNLGFPAFASHSRLQLRFKGFYKK